VTDDAVTGEGAALRNLRVEGLASTAAQSDDGWTAEGWAHVDPLLPQRWSVQVVELAEDGARVTRLPVDASGHAAWSRAGDEGRTVLVVAGATPVTLERGGFHLVVRRPT